MRHFLCRSPAFSVGGLAPGVRTSPSWSLLVAPPCLPNAVSPSRLTAVPRAVALAPVTPGADVDPALTTVAEKSPTVRPHHTAEVAWTPALKPDILVVPRGLQAPGPPCGGRSLARSDVPRVLSPRDSLPTPWTSAHMSRAPARDEDADQKETWDALCHGPGPPPPTPEPSEC
jgi:hypothetical protein